MRIVVTGSAGHLGEALVHALRADGHDVVGLDRLASPTTDVVGTITDASTVDACLAGADAVLHTATLHKPHVDTHSRQAFVDVNITGTLKLLQATVDAHVGCFVFTSTTSAFGRALSAAPDQPAAWITEDVAPVPKNIYGVTKTAAEDLCRLFAADHGLPTVVLRTSRFFPEKDDDPHKRAEWDADNLKCNEFLHRRVEVSDAVDAHRLAIERAPTLGFARFIVSATTPFTPDDAPELRCNAAAVIRRVVPEAEEVYTARGWRLPAGLDRVYDNAAARRELGWRPRFNFAHALQRVAAGQSVLGPTADTIGSKGYHR